MARNEKNTRMCAGCRERKNRSELVRICMTKDGSFSIETGMARSDGRGVYVCLSEKCVENAIKRKSFSRSFKCELPSDIAENLMNFVKTQISE